MTPEASKLISDFFRDGFDSYNYPQPSVAKAIGATQGELNLARKRELIGAGWEKDTRVRYTGRGAIHAGIYCELAPFIGPTRAAEVSAQLVNYVSDVAQGGIESRRLDCVEFTRDEVASTDPLPVSIGSLAADRPSRAALVFPVGELIAQWAVRLQAPKL